MAESERQRRLLEGVVAVTLASGALQAAAPRLTLNRLARKPDGLSAHLFATVGMFMTVSGGGLGAALRPGARDARAPLAWCAAQKVGASAAVAIAVKRRLFSPAALAVAAFDMATAMLIIDYRRKLAG